MLWLHPVSSLLVRWGLASCTPSPRGIKVSPEILPILCLLLFSCYFILIILMSRSCRKEGPRQRLDPLLTAVWLRPRSHGRPLPGCQGRRTGCVWEGSLCAVGWPGFQIHYCLDWTRMCHCTLILRHRMILINPSCTGCLAILATHKSKNTD